MRFLFFIFCVLASSALRAVAVPTDTPTPGLCAGTNAFGVTEVREEGDDAWTGTLDAVPAVLAENGTVVSISIYVMVATGGKIKVGLYTDSGSNTPDALIASSTEQIAVQGWNTLSLAPNVPLTPGTYWLAFAVESGTFVAIAHKSIPNSHRFIVGYSVATPFPPTFSPLDPLNGDNNYSIYASYCPASAVVFTPTPVPIPTATYGCPGSSFTQGNKSAGAFSFPLFSTSEMHASLYDLSETGLLTEMGLYLTSASNGYLRLGIYSDLGGIPGNLMTESGAQVAVAGWNYLAVTPVVLSPGKYWLTLRGIGYMDVAYDSGNTGDEAVSAADFGPLPATFQFPNYFSGRFSIVALFCSAVAGRLEPGNSGLSLNLYQPLLGGTLSVFALPSENGELEVSLFNLAGERVYQLFKGRALAGQKAAWNWNGRNAAGEYVASGTYYVVLEGAGIKQVKKLKVLK